ncbi:hypothetical protein [Nocardioides acrostichi]|uniref:Uncharacterized protein n=1 Tax=Nocardioides acrostichi TaxID=2784339 RepID=A0A930UWW5_9ACTN|nr:hypothetical protein [Nocardioides acrostichi]MBF4160570.1 hypothetical protein [Nocardioides acrostichi]
MSSERRHDGQGDPDDVGSVAEEAAKLLGALSDWAGDSAREQVAGASAGLGAAWAEGLADLAGAAAGAARGLSEHVGHVGEGVAEGLAEGIATGSPECRYCPVCRTVHAVRQLNPEVRDHLQTALASLLQAGAALMAAPAGARRHDAAGVERIDLDAEGDPADDLERDLGEDLAADWDGLDDDPDDSPDDSPDDDRRSSSHE